MYEEELKRGRRSKMWIYDDACEKIEIQEILDLPEGYYYTGRCMLLGKRWYPVVRKIGDSLDEI